MDNVTQNSRTNYGLHPLLVRYAIKRSGDSDLPGHYDPEAQVWVVDTRNGPKPLVEVADGIADLETKTRVDRERDDQEFSMIHEISTKTAVRQERDDVGMPNGISILELTTKTEAQRERDDER